MTEFAKMGGTGESIDVRNIRLKYFPRNIKYDAVATSPVLLR